MYVHMINVHAPLTAGLVYRLADLLYTCCTFGEAKGMHVSRVQVSSILIVLGYI